MFTTTDVDGLTLGPELRSHFLGYLTEPFVAVFAEVVDGDVLGAVHLPDLPVGDIVACVIHALDNHSDMIARRCCQCE